jgi:3-hydroxyacyl-[acyl-carrier-protein] dehydratase
VRFHLIDRIDSYEPKRSVRGRKLTSHSEEYWEDSETGPIMPLPFLLESLCQAATWLIIASTDLRKRAALVSVASAEFLGDVHPGDVLEVEGTVESFGDEAAVISGHITVDGRLVLQAKDIMCTLINVEDLEDADSTRRMKDMLMRTVGA